LLKNFPEGLKQEAINEVRPPDVFVFAARNQGGYIFAEQFEKSRIYGSYGREAKSP